MIAQSMNSYMYLLTNDVILSPVASASPKTPRRYGRMDRLLKRAQSNLEAKFRRDRSGSTVSGAGAEPAVGGSGASMDQQSPAAAGVHVPKIRTPMRALPTDDIKVHSAPRPRDGQAEDVVARVPRRMRGASPVERMPKLISPLKASPEKSATDMSPVASPLGPPSPRASPLDPPSPRSPRGVLSEHQQLRDLFSGTTTHRRDVSGANRGATQANENAAKLARPPRMPSVGNSPSAGVVSRSATGTRRMREEVHPGVMTTSAISHEGKLPVCCMATT